MNLDRLPPQPPPASLDTSEAEAVLTYEQCQAKRRAEGKEACPSKAYTPDRGLT